MRNGRNKSKFICPNRYIATINFTRFCLEWGHFNKLKFKLAHNLDAWKQQTWFGKRYWKYRLGISAARIRQKNYQLDGAVRKRYALFIGRIPCWNCLKSKRRKERGRILLTSYFIKITDSFTGICKRSWQFEGAWYWRNCLRSSYGCFCLERLG